MAIKKPNSVRSKHTVRHRREEVFYGIRTPFTAYKISLKLMKNNEI
jgi:hypothetical protein